MVTPLKARMLKYGKTAPHDFLYLWNNLHAVILKTIVLGEGLFSLLTDEGDGERIFELVQTRFNQMKQRDREYKAERPSLARNGSQDGPNPALPPRQYENKDLEPATHAAPKTVTRAGPGSSRRQPPPPKPGRAPAAAAAGVAPPPKPPTQSKHPTPAAKPGTSAKPSVAELNKIISNNKQALAQNGGKKVDDTYDVMGQADGAGAATYGAAYGDVYGSPAARAKLYTDDTNMYDEVNQP